jgi:hypothetical protein
MNISLNNKIDDIVAVFALDSGIGLGDVLLLRDILHALSVSCGVNKDEIFSSMDVMDFAKKIRLLGGWDELYFLICLEEVLGIRLTNEMQDTIPTFYLYATVGEWIYDIIYKWYHIYYA